MRTILIALALTAACSSDDAATTYDCTELSMAVTQDKTTCTLSHAGLSRPLAFGCAYIQWAYCGTQCPQGWQLSCKGSMTEPQHDCTYDGMCSGSGEDFSTYTASQIYEGRRGLGVVVDVANNRCEFRACE